MPLFSPFFKVLVAICAFAVLASATYVNLLTPHDGETIPSFHLNVYNPKIQSFAAEFLNASGHVTVMEKTASLFKISNYGGLSTADEGMITVYLSTSGDVKRMPWRMGPSLSSIYSGLNLTTTEHGEVLTWENEAFHDGKARFCQTGSKIVILFKGNVPANCSLVDLLAYREK